MRPEAEREHIAGGVVPAGVAGQPARLRHHVAVEEHEDAVRSGARPGVAGPCQPETEILLMDHPHGQRAVRRRLERRVRAVVHDHDLEQLRRIVLTLEGGQGQLQCLGSLVVGDDHADGQRRAERLRRLDDQGSPIVAADIGRGRRAAHSTIFAPSSAV